MTAVTRIRTWWDVRIRHRHELSELLGDPREIEGRVAIVALYPKRELKKSVERLLGNLKDQHVAIVAVVNDSPDADDYRNLLERFATVTIYRLNIGRDFGAYQAGYRFLLKEGKESDISQLLFINDSVLYPKCFPSVLKDVLNTPNRNSGLWMSHEVLPHLQSFFVSLSCETAFSPEVRNFWATYHPTDLKRTVVKRGEIGLSTVIIEAGYNITGLASEEYLFGPTYSGLPSEFRVDEWVVLQKLCRAAAMTETALSVTSKDSEFEKNQKSSFRNLARVALTNVNSTHALGLYATSGPERASGGGDTDFGND